MVCSEGLSVMIGQFPSPHPGRGYPNIREAAAMVPELVHAVGPAWALALLHKAAA